MYRHFFSYCIDQTDVIFKDHILVARIIATIVVILMAVCVFPIVLYSNFKVLEEKRKEMEKTVGYYEEDMF